jgi:hypothetical protein
VCGNTKALLAISSTTRTFGGCPLKKNAEQEGKIHEIIEEP